MFSALERDQDRQHLMTRRSLLLLAGQTALALVLLGRAGQLQLVRGASYNLLSEENRISLRILPPARGHLIDRKNQPLAINQQSYRAVILREEVKDLETTLNRFADVIDLSPEDRTRIARELKRHKNFMPVALKTNLSWNEMARLEVLTPELPGISVDAAEQRFYPLGAAAAHSLGYLGAPSENDVENNKDPLLTVSGFQVGKIGIEKTYEDRLRGSAGGAQLEVNARGRVVQELKRTAPTPGKNLQLTIDADLQQFMYDRQSQERSAAAIVMDIYSGAVYGMCSTPAYDPNIFIQGIPSDLWQQLTHDPTKPMLNKVFGGTYPPGSTFKMVTALAALESGTMKIDTPVFCPGFTQLGSHIFHCWKKDGHGSVTLRSAIQQSCDCYFYEAARRAGIDRIKNVSQRLGLGEATGIGLPGERTGLVPSREWKRKTYKHDWTVGESFVCGIGQGYVNNSILQLAIMTARLVNGGRAISPILEIQKLPNAPGNILGFDPVHLAAIGEGMQAVTLPGGTAAASQIPIPEFQIAGKTGTAQVRRISMADRAAGFDVFKLPWEQRHHALFVGYAPVAAPQYAMACIVEHGGAAGSVAAPLGRDILHKTQELAPAKNFTPMDSA
jgi:penicillin-binding protein 2